MDLAQRHKRAALRAGIGMGMKAPVGGILILRAAAVAHPELGHGGVLAVVGNVPEDGETRSAVGAADEWIQVTPVVRLEQLPLAVRTDGDIR
jgi:hypothetical protein